MLLNVVLMVFAHVTVGQIPSSGCISTTALDRKQSTLVDIARVAVEKAANRPMRSECVLQPFGGCPSDAMANFTD